MSHGKSPAEWPPAVRRLAGAWKDFPDVEELRLGLRRAEPLDPMDYRLLHALVELATGRREGGTEELLGRYLDEEISLARVAEGLGVSRCELMERFERLGLPLRNGATDLGDAREEVKAASEMA